MEHNAVSCNLFHTFYSEKKIDYNYNYLGLNSSLIRLQDYIRFKNNWPLLKEVTVTVPNVNMSWSIASGKSSLVGHVALFSSEYLQHWEGPIANLLARGAVRALFWRCWSVRCRSFIPNIAMRYLRRANVEAVDTVAYRIVATPKV